MSLANLESQCLQLLEAKQSELNDLNSRTALLKAEVVSLEKVAKSIEAANEKGKPSNGRHRTRDRGRTRRIIEILQTSPKALDLGAIVTQLGEDDNANNRTRVSAALTRITSDPQGAVVRVSPGIYAART
jgi:hypothetical protein